MLFMEYIVVSILQVKFNMYFYKNVLLGFVYPYINATGL